MLQEHTENTADATGYLGIVIGCMYAGKTTYLLDEIENYRETKGNADNILVIKHSLDVRYDNAATLPHIISHNDRKYPCVPLTNLKDIFNLEELDSKNIIIIDEAQFFKDVYDVVINLVENMNKNVYLAGLDGDFSRMPFNDGDFLNLIPIADEVVKLNSKCAYCDKRANFSRRIVESQEQILVGSSCYKPVCRFHYRA
jgi:thymidine kinase